MYGIFRARKSGCAGVARRVFAGAAPTARVQAAHVLGGGRRAGKGATAMIYYPPQILFLRRRELTAFAFIHLFPFHGSPGGAAPPLFRSAPSFKVTDCLLYYPLVSIFTHSSSARSRASEPSRVLASLSLGGDANSSPAYTLFGRTRSAFGACRRRATRAFYADRMCFSSESPGHEVRLFYDCQGIGNL